MVEKIFHVDYHFHANLPRSDRKAILKCKSRWEECKEKGINVLISTEHVFKDPKRAFEFMEKTKPRGFYVFPGVEYLTTEGAEILIFSNSKKIYSFKELEPLNLNYHETVEFILKKNLVGVIAHPYAFGPTSMMRVCGLERYISLSNILNSIEISNSGLNNLYRLLKCFPLNYIFKSEIVGIKLMKKVPEESYPKRVRLLAVGSDAHHLGELGTHVVIKSTEKELFNKISHNENPEYIEKEYEKPDLILLLRQLTESLFEFSIKFRLMVRKRLATRKARKNIC